MADLDLVRGLRDMTGAYQRYRSWLADSSRWDDFRFRPGDIVISTPAKSGTTWMQMICALLVFGDARLARPLTELSPWLDLATRPISDVFATLEAQRHRRFIKTHTPLDGLPFDERATYICVGRDPRDAAISSDNQLSNMDREVLIKARAQATDHTGRLPLHRQSPRGQRLRGQGLPIGLTGSGTGPSAPLRPTRALNCCSIT